MLESLDQPWPPPSYLGQPKGPFACLSSRTADAPAHNLPPDNQHNLVARFGVHRPARPFSHHILYAIAVSRCQYHHRKATVVGTELALVSRLDLGRPTPETRRNTRLSPRHPLSSSARCPLADTFRHLPSRLFHGRGCFAAFQIEFGPLGSKQLCHIPIRNLSSTHDRHNVISVPPSAVPQRRRHGHTPFWVLRGATAILLRNRHEIRTRLGPWSQGPFGLVFQVDEAQALPIDAERRPSSVAAVGTAHPNLPAIRPSHPRCTGRGSRKEEEQAGISPDVCRMR